MLRRAARHLLHHSFTLSSLDGQYIRLEVIRGKNLRVHSFRMPAGIYVSIQPYDTRSAIQVLRSDESVVWGDTVILSPDASSSISFEIRASFELGRMLGHGELIAKLETSWNKLLDHGDEAFDITFPARGVQPSLTLKAIVVHACRNKDGALFDSVIEYKIARCADMGHIRFADYIRSGSNVYLLNSAMIYFQWVLDQCPVGHPDRAAALTNLAWARLHGYIQNDLKDIDFTTSLFRDALALRPQGHPDHRLSLYHLTQALRWRHNNQHTPADIRESAQLYHKLLPLCPEGTYLRNIAAGDNGVNYVFNGCNDIPTDASNEGIHLRRIVLELCPPGNQHRPRSLDNLAQVVEARFDQHGSIDDLEETIQLRREAVSLYPEGHSGSLNNLAVSLRSRFQFQGKSHDLDEAISLHEEALRLRPVGHESRDASLSNLGGALRSRFNQRGDMNDINRAVNLYYEALALCPTPTRDTTLNNLALALKTRYDKLSVGEDLDKAIDMYRESLRLKQPGHPERHRTLFNLSSALCSRFMQTQENEDVEEAIALCEESLVALPPLHPDRHYSYFRLREAHVSLYQIQHNPADLSLAVKNFRLASTHPTQGFPQRIRVAIDWALQAEVYQHESALDAYHTCLELLDIHVMTRSSIISRRDATTAFRGAQSLPVDAASCAIRRNDLQQAVKLEERGRGQQWSLASRLRTPLDDLKLASLPLAHKLSELSKRLSDAQGSTGSSDRAAADRAAIEYRKLTGEWETVASEIRTLQGFSRFLLPLSYEDLQVAACHGPVIILIASRYSCNAIIVPTSGQPHHVPFPSLTLAHLKVLKNDFAKVIRNTAGMSPKEPRAALIALLRKIWDEVMLPIVKVLQRDLKLPGHSRIWLCPTAAFISIPLHAAHPFRPKANGDGRELCLEDIYICSYTPTLSALIRARQKMKTRAATSFVAIGQSQPPAGQGEALLTIDSELELVRSLVPAMANPTTLVGDAATRAGALQALQCNTWVHLACHGKQDHEQPYYSHFAMRDKPLTLLDIMDNNAPHAEFAFLSACHTATGDEETPDEAIHLAAGLQFSGFKSVIGTLWVVDDAVAKHVVKGFYENMFKDLEEGDMPDCTKAAWALNKATYAVKKEVPLEQRIVFIHIGV